MAAADFEIEDLITCSVCFLQYDETLRIPKDLQCFHTVCLQCLKEIFKENAISCPLCRAQTECRDATHLHTNNYALCMVDMNNRWDSERKRQNIWCIDCVSAAETGCLDNHCSINVSSVSAETCSKLKKDMDDCKSDLKAAIDKRKEHQAKLSEVLRSIKEVETDIVKRWEDCDFRITQLDSFSDNIDKSGQPESFEAIKGKVDAALTFLNEESDVMDQSSVDETILNRIVILSPESAGQEMTAVSITNFDENDPKYFQKTLLVHLLASILEPREIAEDSTCDESESPSSSDSNASLGFVSPSAKTPSSEFRFSLKVHSDQSLLGEIHIEPSSAFDPTFINDLVQFCQRTQSFKTEVASTVADSLVMLDFMHDDFHPTLPCGSKETVRNKLDVGMIPLKSVNGDQTVHWELVFLLKDVKRPSKIIERSTLFGRVTAGSYVIGMLSRRRVVKTRKGLISITWNVF